MTSGGLDSIPDGSIVTGYRYNRKLTGRAFEFSFAPTRQFVVVSKDRIVITEITGFDRQKQAISCKNLNPAFPETYNFHNDEIQEIYAIVAVTEYRGEWLPGRIYMKHYEPYLD